jgi:hypothetical protein
MKRLVNVLLYCAFMAVAGWLLAEAITGPNAATVEARP